MLQIPFWLPAGDHFSSFILLKFIVMDQTTISILGIRIDEPVATLTDLVVAAVCFYAASRIYRWKERNDLFFYLKYYFLTMGLATTMGGLLGHGFFYLFPFYWKLPGWLMSMFSVMLIERAAIEHVTPLIGKKLARSFKIINLIELCTFVVVTYSTLNFFFVEVHTAYGLLFVVGSLQLFNFYRTRNAASKYFLIAVAISALAALIFMNEITLGRWFNHFDISHTIMAFSAWFFYRAAKELKLKNG